jgi:hypothetical protein
MLVHQLTVLNFCCKTKSVFASVQTRVSTRCRSYQTRFFSQKSYKCVQTLLHICEKHTLPNFPEYL